MVSFGTQVFYGIGVFSFSGTPRDPCKRPLNRSQAWFLQVWKGPASIISAKPDVTHVNQNTGQSSRFFLGSLWYVCSLQSIPNPDKKMPSLTGQEPGARSAYPWSYHAKLAEPVA